MRLDGESLPEHEPPLNPDYLMPEKGDEDLSPFALDCRYHVPFEGTLFELRKGPRLVLLAKSHFLSCRLSGFMLGRIAALPSPTE